MKRTTKLIVRDLREQPAYTIQEASHYLRLPVSTLRYWAVGGKPFGSAKNAQSLKPILALPDKEQTVLSFTNLVEAHVLAALRRQHNISFPRVRASVNYLMEKFPTRHPLADHQFETDGLYLFIEHLGRLINITEHGQLAMRKLLQIYLRRIERDPRGFPIRLYPFTRDPETDEPRAVVIDPRISFGRPVLSGTGIATAIIAERFKAGEASDTLASDYGRDRADIEEAIRCELALPRAA